MVINSNIEAQRTAGNLQRSQEAMQRSLSRLSSGSKIVNPSDDAAGVAVSSRLESELRRMESVMNNLSHATSFTQTQDGYLKNMDAAFTRMSELAMLASDGTKQSSDRNLYDEEFQHLMSYVRSARATDFNGVPLFNGSTVDVSIDEKGNSFAIGGIDLNASVYENAIKEPSWQLTSQVWATSTSGYVTNQSTYQLETTAYKLYTDLYYNDSTTPKWATSDNGGTPYSAGSWVINDGSTINENPPTGSVRTYSTGDFTTDNLGDPNLSNGLFTATTHYKSHSAGSFLSSDPTATGDLTNSQRSVVPAGYYVGIDPTSTGSSQDAAATAYQIGQTVSTEQDLTGSATSQSGVSLTTLDKASSALTLVMNAMEQLRIDRASLGAIMQRVEYTTTQLSTSKHNLTQAKSRISDVNVAEETTRYAKQQILVQSGTQMLREANNLPLTALELLK